MRKPTLLQLKGPKIHHETDEYVGAIDKLRESFDKCVIPGHLIGLAINEFGKPHLLLVPLDDVKSIQAINSYDSNVILVYRNELDKELVQLELLEYYIIGAKVGKENKKKVGRKKQIYPSSGAQLF